MSDEPVDVTARTTIRSEHEATLFVTAGAGTGKTTSLVQRIVALVATGKTDLTDLAAITFTEAAAGELRDRVRGALEAAARGDVDWVSGAEARQRCAFARLQIDDAALCTLHAFAQRIIATNPLSIRVPPRFRVLDEIESAVTLDRNWSALLDVLYGDPAFEPAMSAAAALQVPPHRWRDIAYALHEHWDRVPAELASNAPGAVPPIDTNHILGELDAIAEQRQHCADPTDVLLKKIDQYAQWAVELRASRGLDHLEVLRRKVPAPGKSGRIENWRERKATLLESMGHVLKEQAELLRDHSDAVLRAVLPRIFQWCLDNAANRRAEGELEFHDLLVLAREMLREPSVRQMLHDKYSFLLIDEFQDTDPLQIELAMSLAASATEGPLDFRDWSTINVEPGRLFFVGDPKQSIYRFRRADLALYAAASQRFDDGAVELVQNFRSVPGIVEWVNTTFESVLNTQSDRSIQAPPLALRAYREALQGSGPAVAAFGAESSERAADVRFAEASDVAAVVLEALDHWTVWDDKLQCERPAQLRDIALLLPTRTALAAIDAALDAADITARIESRSLVFATTEVRDLLAILESIHDPGAHLATVAALRSAGFACSDRELAEWALAKGSWDYRISAPDALEVQHPVANAMSVLSGFHSRAASMAVSDVVQMVIDDLELLALATFHRRPRDRWRRLHFLLHHARAFDHTAPAEGLGGFLTWARLQDDEGATAIETPVPEPDDDAVRILTVHGSKGLEFPIVILAGLGSKPAHRRIPMLAANGALEFNAGTNDAPVGTVGFAAAMATERAHETAERARLMYVACTRARDHLVISRYHNAKATGSHAALLHPYCDNVEQIDLQSPTPPRRPRLEPSQSSAFDEQSISDAFEAVERDAARDAARFAAAATPSAISATAVAAAAITIAPAAVGDHGGTEAPTLEDDAHEQGARVEDDATPWLRGRAGSALGRAVHAVLQYCDLERGRDIAVLAREQADAEHIPHREAEIAARARAIIATSTVARAVAGRHWRELSVTAQLDGVTVEGYIDLLIETDGELWVVDYKTDAISGPAALAAAAHRYGPQAATYALAVEAAIGRSVERAVLIFSGPQGAHEVIIDDLDDARDRARSAIARMMQP